MSAKERQARYAAKNKEKIAAYQKEWRAKNLERELAKDAAYRRTPEGRASAAERQRLYRERHPERVRASRETALPKTRKQDAEYRARNKEKTKAAIRAWRVANPHKDRAAVMRRIAAKKFAVPRWADHAAIADVYAEAVYMQMDVDHIVPLQSKIVCGLHVWDNLQLLPKAANISKGNRWWPDMPEGL